jgi:hypothetical protein
VIEKATAARKRSAEAISTTNASIALDPENESWNPKRPSFTEMRNPARVAIMVPAPMSAVQTLRVAAVPTAKTNAATPWTTNSGPIVAMWR